MTVKKAGKLRRIASSIIVALLFLSLYVFAFTVQPAKAELGTIYIRADGSIYPTTAPISTKDNITYTLTGNIINNSIVVQRDNIVVDGRGYTVQGTGNGTGIDLSGLSNVTVKNMTIKAFYYGVSLNSSSGCIVSGNNITANSGSGVFLFSSSSNSISGNNITNSGTGVYLYSSSGCTVSGNNITANTMFGVFLNSSSYCTVSGNMFQNDGLGVWASFHNAVKNNFVNGKPLVYLEGNSSYTVSDAGQVVLVNCRSIVVNNFNLSNASIGVELWQTNSTRITNNNITKNFVGVVLVSSSGNSISGNKVTANSGPGIIFFSSSGNSISGNKVTANSADGIILESSSNNNNISGNNVTANSGTDIGFVSSSGNSISGNKVTASSGPGIILMSSSSTSISGNNVTNNQFGVYLYSISGCTVSGNNIANNQFGVYLYSISGCTVSGNNIANSSDGVILYNSSSTSISGNNIANNQLGVYLFSSSSNSIIGNDIANNRYGIYLASSSNRFFHNNFINNTMQVSSTGSPNTWDNGYPSGGNYWSDYEARYPSAAEIDSSGIWNTPYVIDANNTDRYPLMAPFARSWWPMFHHDLSHTGYSTSTAPETNQTLWTYTTGYEVYSPAVVNGVVYVGSWDHRLYALNAETGNQVWNYTTGSYVDTSPAVAGGVVYVGSYDDYVYAINATTGKKVWSYRTGAFVEYSSPAVAGGLVYIGSDDDRVYALNATTGNQVWNYTTGSSVQSSPAVVNGVVYVGSHDDNVYALNATTGSLVWKHATGGLVVSSPAVVNGVVYVGSWDHRLYALNATTGNQVWNYTTGSYVYSSPAVAGGLVYIGSDDDRVYALNATTGNQVWNYTTGGYVEYSSPAVAGGIVYVGSNDWNVYALNASTGVLVWKYTTGGPVWSSPAVVNGVVYVGSNDWNVYAFGSRPSVSISPGSVVMDVGQSQLFTSNVSGGTSPYSYQWYLNGAAVPSATGSSWTFTPTSSGSYTVYVNATDSVGFRMKSNIATVTVNPTLSVTISPSSATLDVGQSQAFTSTVTGGTSPYSYQWYLDGSAVSGANGTFYTYSPSAAGSHTVYVKVTDSASTPATAQSNSASVTVNGAFSVTISPSSVTLDVGQSRNFTCTVSGGTSPYSYQWYLGGSAIPSATSSYYVYTPSTSGSYSIYLNVTDSASTPKVAKSNTATVTVNAAFSVSISPTSVTLDVGQSKTFTSIVTGGTGSHTYQWYLNGTLVGTGSNYTFTPGSPGFHNIYLNVTDSLSMKAKSNTATVTVNAALSVTISPSTWTMDVGQSKLFTSSASGGSGSYSYHWYLDGVAVSGATGATWTYTPSAAGPHTVYFKVTDSASTPVTATSNNATVTVNGALSVTISPSTVTMDVGQPKTFTSTVTGGTSSYSYQWYLNGAAVSGANSSAWTFTPNSSGSYSVYVNVTDSVGVKVKSNVATVTVNTAPSVGILPTSATIHVGNSQVFTSTVSGGTSPPSYQWYLNGSAVSSATSATWTFTPSSTGSYNVYVKVTDAVGAVATSTPSTVTVLPVIPEFQPSMLLPLFMIITLLGAIILKRKRNAKTTQSTATE